MFIHLRKIISYCRRMCVGVFQSSAASKLGFSSCQSNDLIIKIELGFIYINIQTHTPTPMHTYIHIYTYIHRMVLYISCICIVPWGGHSNPLQYSCLENPMDKGVRWATVHRVTKSWTWLMWLSIHSCTYIICNMHIHVYLWDLYMHAYVHVTCMYKLCIYIHTKI